MDVLVVVTMIGLLITLWGAAVLWLLHGIHEQVRYLARQSQQRLALDHPQAAVEPLPGDGTPPAP